MLFLFACLVGFGIFVCLFLTLKSCLPQRHLVNFKIYFYIYFERLRMFSQKANDDQSRYL